MDQLLVLVVIEVHHGVQVHHLLACLTWHVADRGEKTIINSILGRQVDHVGAFDFAIDKIPKFLE